MNKQLAIKIMKDHDFEYFNDLDDRIVLKMPYVRDGKEGEMYITITSIKQLYRELGY